MPKPSLDIWHSKEKWVGREVTNRFYLTSRFTFHFPDESRM